MPGATGNLGHAWFISTVLLTSLGFYMWPHSFASTFTARSAATLRRNSVVMPLYTLTLVFIFFAGFAAVLIVPGLKQRRSRAPHCGASEHFPPWFLGSRGWCRRIDRDGSGRPIFILCSATLFAKNLVRPLFAPQMSDDQVRVLARIMVVLLGLCSLALAIFGSGTLVSMLLTGYAGVTQFFPGVVLGIYWPRVTMPAVAAGMVTGVTCAVLLMGTHHDPVFGVSAGFVALCLNFLIVVVVSLLAPQTDDVQKAFEPQAVPVSEPAAASRSR